MTSLPTASIVIRAFNAEPSIERALRSALAQDLDPDRLEVIVVDDGSTDGTPKAVRSFGDRVTLLRQPNQGAVPAANAGLRAAGGRYVTLLDADDEFSPSLVRRLSEVLESEPLAQLAYSDYYEEFEGVRRRVSPRDVFESLAGGVLFRRSWLAAAGFFREDVLFAEYDLHLRTLGACRSVHLAEPLFIYHRTRSSLTADQAAVREGMRHLEALHPEKVDVVRRIRSYALGRPDAGDSGPGKPAGRVELRRAGARDGPFLLSLRNEAMVRQASFQTGPVAQDVHERWMSSKLSDPRTHLYIAELEGEPIGQVRVDLDGESGEISVAVDPRFRGQGVGTAAVEQACERVFEADERISTIVARLRPENAASARLFARAGFLDRGLRQGEGWACRIMERSR